VRRNRAGSETATRAKKIFFVTKYNTATHHNIITYILKTKPENTAQCSDDNTSDDIAHALYSHSHSHSPWE
jgi:hypothetical protein